MTNKELLHTATTQDYNDMREMITELEQKLISVDPVRQMTFYQALQNRLYEMLNLDSNEDNMILYPHTVQPINYN
jgi:hypothetical protein